MQARDDSSTEHFTDARAPKTRQPLDGLFQAILATEIIKALDKEHLTICAAHDRTASRRRTFHAFATQILDGLRLVSVLNRLGSRIEVKICVRRIEAA